MLPLLLVNVDHKIHPVLVKAGDQNILQPSVFKLSQDIQPELCTFILSHPHAEQFFVSIKINA